MTDARDPSDDEIATETDLSTTDVYEAMETFEPYTTGELASAFDIPTRLVRKFLNRLTADERIRRKVPVSDRTIWIREPPKHEYPQCGRGFEIKFLHPIFQSVQFCPQCGAQIK